MERTAERAPTVEDPEHLSSDFADRIGVRYLEGISDKVVKGYKAWTPEKARELEGDYSPGFIRVAAKHLSSTGSGLIGGDTHTYTTSTTANSNIVRSPDEKNGSFVYIMGVDARFVMWAVETAIEKWISVISASQKVNKKEARRIVGDILRSNHYDIDG